MSESHTTGTWLRFHREDRGDGNRYIFIRLDGTEIDLPPDATVSELQNRL